MIGVCRQQLKHCLQLQSGYHFTLALNGISRQNSGGIESSKHMLKLLTKKGAKTKRKWYQPHVAEPQELSGRKQQPNKYGVTEAQGHRARQLSHVLYAKICQIANSGELDEEILNKQVLFTKVKMHPTFSGINVYWDAKRSDAAEIETLLDGLSGKLRSLLISYHVLGRIPTITFVKDRSRGDLAQLNQLFEIADYGPDYVPSTEMDKDKSHIMMLNSPQNTTESPGHPTKNNLHENLSALALSFEQPGDIHESEKSRGDRLKTLSSEAGWESECEPPTGVGLKDTPDELVSGFRANLYGLPRDDLMKKIMIKKKKVRFQTSSTEDSRDTSISDLQLRDYRKLRSRVVKDKEKMLQQRDSTKIKQRLLERGFDEEQDFLHEDFTDDERNNNDRETH
ncbi:hypothetical protein EGW08_016807 [Elysia chlorotica]|uniref:Ribosome-binding factor A, mitochondrial n=1 Tax=Elysia chlorotica TaxID=188477 RepID=A0A3S0ZC18_ELYCH|nr:hypothetical protein EGW08_016807 [Elysia chlorotica]